MKDIEPQNSKRNETPRQPVVAVLGHVDHGKSTLLDYIRKTKIAEQEAGGITQCLGAYEVEVPQINADTKTQMNSSGIRRGGTTGNGADKNFTGAHQHSNHRESMRRITFLDTPGHEAFKGIRERGATVADVAILVVSAEDGVKPQTLEALKYIMSAKIPYLVAITKIDKPNANVERVKQNLAEHKVFVEGYGGDIPCNPISSKTGKGVQELLDMILLVADLNQIATHINEPATGFVIESNRASKSGVAATLLIKDGILHKGSFAVAEKVYAPVRFIENFRADDIPEATPGQAVRVSGWNDIPRVGAKFTMVTTKKDAEEQAVLFSEKAGKKDSTEKAETTAGENIITLPVIIKADSGGSLEALEHEIKKQQTEQVVLKIVSKGIGSLNESDLKTAASCRDSLVVGFNVSFDPSAKDAFDRSGVQFAVFDVIYKLAEWITASIKERSPKILVENLSGNARVLKLFSSEKDRQIIGCRVLDGEIRRGDEFRVLRRDAKVGSGKIRELQLQKKKIDSASKDSEFGAFVSASLEIAVGDIIEAFTIVEK